MNARYLPAIIKDTVTDRWGLRPIHAFDDRVRKTGAFCDACLVSAPLWRRPRKMLADDVYVFGDSGGFQVINGADPDPVAGLHWQLLNADEGPLLDHPPVEGKAPVPSDPELRFSYCLFQTEQNVKMVAPMYRSALQTGTDFRLLGVVHGATDAQLEEWYARISAIYPFEREGWAHRLDPQDNPEAIARLMAFCRRRGITRLHLFRPGGPETVATALALGRRAGLRDLSWDNTSPLVGGNYRDLWLPDDDGLNWWKVSERFRDTGGRDRRARRWMRRVCSCPSCRWMDRDIRESPDDPGEEYRKLRIRYHNLLLALDVYRNLDREARRDPPGLLRRMLGEEAAGSVLRTFEGSAIVA